MPKPPRNWPSGALPRLMDIACAAFYVGLSASTFRARVDAGQYPEPRREGRRCLWDRAALDAAIDGASGRGGSPDGRDYAEEAKAIARIEARHQEERRQIERIMEAHQRGESSREIGIREKMTTQKIASIIRWEKKRPRR